MSQRSVLGERSETLPAHDTMLLNMGPQHPSTHGVLRLMLELDGEVVVEARPDIGFLHTGIEKSCEYRTYHQAITLTDRIDYLSPYSNNLAYVNAVEKLFDITAPPRAAWLRVLLAELHRIGSHLLWLGTTSIDLDASSMLIYCFREREDIVRRREMEESVKICRQVLAKLPAGPIRIDDPLVAYPKRELIHRSMESLIHHYKLATDGPIPPPGEAYAAVESPRGEYGVHVVSNGTNLPQRVRFRAPSFANLQALRPMVRGHMVADCVAALASIDFVLGEVDR